MILFLYYIQVGKRKKPTYACSPVTCQNSLLMGNEQTIRHKYVINLTQTHDLIILTRDLISLDIQHTVQGNSSI